jgi:RND family efflux transporter MFP subunit
MSATVDLRQLAVRRDDPAPRRGGRRRHIVTRYLLPAGVLAGFLGVAGWAARDSLLPSRPVTVVPVLATRAEVRQEGAPLFQAAGWVEPRPTPTLVTALTEGVVEQLLVVEDQPVKAGEPVARLVDADARIALRAAEADLALRQAEAAGARSTLATARTNFDKPVSLEAAFAEADAMLAQKETERATLPAQARAAEAKLVLARQTLDGALRATSGVSVINRQQYEADRDTCAAAVDELKAKRDRIEREVAALTQKRDALRQRLELKTEEARQLGEAEAALKAAEARVAQAQAALDAARLRLERMTVRAPSAGRVLALIARPGTRLMGLAPNSLQDASNVVSLYDPDRLQVRADVRLEDVPRVRPGQAVKVETPSAPVGPLDGEVLYATPLADVQKNTLQVKVALKSPPATVRPDMLVRVTFLAPPAPKSLGGESEPLRLLVPWSLVESGEGGATVWLADRAAGVARRRAVRLGAAGTGDLVEVAEGLAAGDRLIAAGREGLRDGERVTVTDEDAALGTSAPATAGAKAARPQRLPAADHKAGH